MFENERILYAFTLDYARMLAEGIDDDQIAHQPSPGMNPPAWILGHLALCTDYARQMLGESPVLPESWAKLFGPGTTPTTDRSAYPSKAELMDALVRGQEAVLRAANTADPSKMDAPHPLDFAFLKGRIETIGQLLAHLLTTHQAFHLGQLSTWRRVMGLPGVLTL